MQKPLQKIWPYFLCPYLSIYLVAPSPRLGLNFDRIDPIQAAFWHPIVSFQNLGPEKFQEVREKGLANFSALKKPDMWGTLNPRDTSVYLVVSKNAVEQDVDSWAALFRLNILASAQLFICKTPPKNMTLFYWPIFKYIYSNMGP